MKLRVCGGKYKRLQINIPESLDGFRPTKNMVREAICNVLTDKIYDADVLELCAGSCIFSLEMISRGAKRALAVEKDSKLCAFLKERINKLFREEQIEILCEDAAVFTDRTSEKFDIIFFDPPYYTNELAEVAVKLPNICKKYAIIVFEFASDDNFVKDIIAKNYSDYKIRKYGKSSLAFIYKGG